MKFFSRQTIFEVLAAILVNLTSAWLGILFVAPGLFGVSLGEYGRLLLINLPFGIAGLVGSLWLTEGVNWHESCQY